MGRRPASWTERGDEAQARRRGPGRRANARRPVAEVFGDVIAAGQAAGEFTTAADPRAAALLLFDASGRHWRSSRTG
jgi:hypothetical protein